MAKGYGNGGKLGASSNAGGGSTLGGMTCDKTNFGDKSMTMPGKPMSSPVRGKTGPNGNIKGGRANI